MGLWSRAAGLDLLKSLAAAREFAHNGFDSGRPDKRSGVLVPDGEKLVNCGDQFVDAQEGIAADSLAG